MKVRRIMILLFGMISLIAFNAKATVGENRTQHTPNYLTSLNYAIDHSIEFSQPSPNYILNQVEPPLQSTSILDNKSPLGVSWFTVLASLAGIIEISMRLIPTSQSWAPLSIIYKLINAIIPDRKAGGSVFTITEAPKKE